MFSLHLSKNLFWDIDLSKFDNIRNMRLIIERVFTMGDLADVKEVFRFYGVETIKQEIIKAGYLDNKTLSWLSNFLDIPKTKFQCFTKNKRSFS